MGSRNGTLVRLEQAIVRGLPLHLPLRLWSEQHMLLLQRADVLAELSTPLLHRLFAEASEHAGVAGSWEDAASPLEEGSEPMNMHGTAEGVAKACRGPSCPEKR
jgi:hypothetical protein